jgi:arylsulfatase A-like enzyme
MSHLQRNLSGGALYGALYGLTLLIFEDLVGYTVNGTDFSAVQVAYSLIIYAALFCLAGLLLTLLIRAVPTWRSASSLPGRILLALTAVSILILGYRDFVQHTVYVGGTTQLLIAAVWGCFTLALFWGLSFLAKRLGGENRLLIAFAASLTVLLILNIKIDYDPIVAAGFAGVAGYWRLATLIFASGVFLTVRTLAGLKSPSRISRPAAWLVSGTLLLIASVILGLAVVHRPDRKPQTSEYLRGDTDPPNVILVVIDALRADHLDLYGYNRETSPSLAKLAGKGVLFKNALAPSSWTRPSVASYLPGPHSAIQGLDGKDDLLPSNLVTLAETFRDRGYFTAGFSSNVFVSSTYNFDRGFQHFRYLPGHGPRQLLPPYFLYSSPYSKLREVLYRIGFIDGNLAYGTASTLTQEAVLWLSKNPRSRFFLYLHYMDPHFPYFPEKQHYSAGDKLSEEDLDLLDKLFHLKGSRDVSAEFVETIKSRYDDEIRAVDAALETLFARLVETGLKDNTLVVITADHGEGFAEHGHFDHGHTMYDELLHVPLIVFFPNGKHGGETVAEQVDLLDLAPTLYDYIGFDPPNLLDGASLLPLIEGDADRYRRSRGPYFGYVQPPWDDWPADSILALVEGRYKLIRSVHKDPERPVEIELYDLDADPAESVNLADSLPRVTAELLAAMNRILAACDSLRVQPSDTSQTTLSDEDLERLRALGYVR